MDITPVENTQEVDAWVKVQFESFNRQHGYQHTKEEFCYELRHAQQRLGIARGYYTGGWCYLQDIAVDESARGQGAGSKLLHYLEEQARHKNMHGVHLTTIAFQAPGFYRKLGYQKMAELPNYAGAGRHYYIKTFE